VLPEEDIKQLAIQRGAELVGIASVADINEYAPSGHRPDDFLSGAKSVIVIAGRPTTRGAWHSPDYRSHTANLDFFRIRGGIALAIAKFIEAKYGYYAIGDTPPAVGYNGSLSLKLCAEMAGLGNRTLAGGVIMTRELGVINLAAVVTTMPLKADGPVKELVCPHPSCVKRWARDRTTPCLVTCPECLSGELEDGQIKWMRYDRRICSNRAQNLSPNSFQRLLLEGINEPNMGKRKSMLLGSFARSAVLAIAIGPVVGQCGECFRHCPVVLRAQTLKHSDDKKKSAGSRLKQEEARSADV